MDKSLRPVARPRSQTGEMTKYNRPVWKDEQSGEVYSEKTVTVPYGDGFVVMPSVGRDGSQYTEEQIYEYVKRNGPVDFVTGEKLPIFESPDQADTYARGRSDKMFSDEEPMPEFRSRRPEMEQEDTGTSMMDVGKAVAKLGLAGAQLAGKKLGMDINPTADNPMGFAEGGNVPMNKQMEMFEDGGLMDEGGMVDEVSGNDVPPGSTRKEVRDDIPARLSEGEFVFPADVVRYYGLEKLMELRQNAKMGLKQMEAMGQMGNSDEATMPDDIPFGMEDIIVVAEPQEFADGGMPQPLPIAPVPVRKGNQSPLSGMTGGMTMVTYVNDQGNTMVIPHVNGVPIYPIPDGYRVMAEGESVTGSDAPASSTASQQASGTQTTAQQRPEEFGGGPDPEPSDFDITELSDAELDAMIAAPTTLGGRLGKGAAALLGGPVMSAVVSLGLKANASRAKAEKSRRAINEDVQKTIDKLAEEEEAPVKGAPVSPVTQSNIDDEDVPSSFNFADEDAVMGQPVGSPSAAPTAPSVSSAQSAASLGFGTDAQGEFSGTPDMTGIQTEAMLDAALSNPSLDEGIMGIDSNVPGQLTGGKDVSAQVAQSVANQAAAARGAFTGQDEAITGITESPVSNTSVGARGYANPPSNSANLTGIMGMGTDFSQPGADTGRATAPSVGPVSSAASAMNQGYSALGEFYGAPTDTSVNNEYSGLAGQVGLGSPSNAPSGNFGGGRGDISGAQSAASMGFGSDPGGEFGGGPDGSGASGPSGGSSGGTGGGGADSGGAANGGGSSGGSSGGDAGTGSDNDGDGFGDMGGISGGWNKGGLVSKKKKPAKRKPNTSRGIAARKK